MSENETISPKEAKNRFLHRCYTYTSTSLHNMRNKDDIDDFSENKEDEIVNSAPYSEEPLYSTVKKKKKKSGIKSRTLKLFLEGGVITYNKFINLGCSQDLANCKKR